VLTAGVSRQIASVGPADISLGARASVNFVPATLLATYGTRTPAGFALYANVRPNRQR
jgi:hypothetical protein